MSLFLYAGDNTGDNTHAVSLFLYAQDNTEKIWAHRFFMRQNTNISKIWNFNLAVWVNDTYCPNDHKAA